MRFRDRIQAGQELAEQLRGYAEDPDALVLGLPRGGVPVAAEIAGRRGSPLGVLVGRKRRGPGQGGVGRGASASGGVRVLNDEVIEALGIDGMMIGRVAAAGWDELIWREQQYRGDRPFPP